MKPEEPNRDVGYNAGAVENSELSELQWTAFRYLTDELPPELSADFEQHLAHSPAAAEALEQMLSLLAGLEANFSEASQSLTTQATPVQRKSNWTEVRRTARWLSAMAAVVLVLLGTSRFVSTKYQDSRQESLEVSLDEEEMAELWAGNLSNDLLDSAEEPADDMPESDEWLYSALVSLESLENWPAEEQGGS